MANRLTIAALGAGRMGRGLAHAFAYAGHDVWLIDIKPRDRAALAALERAALAEIEGSLSALASLGVFDAIDIPTILARVRFVGLDGAPATLAECDVCFEGVPERMDAKQEALRFASRRLRADALLASTTSTFLVTDLAEYVSAPQRFMNAHWLNPAYVVPLVELSPHAATDALALGRMQALLKDCGKVPVVCAAAPGFIVPRLQALVMNEAARLVEEGLATAQDIDLATRYGLGFRFAALGVIEFCDYGGNDILYYASRYLSQALGSTRFAAPAIVERLMQEGKLGLKTGQGFYDYRGVDEAAYRRDALARLVAMLRQLELVRPPAA